jgi:hypothetical protein
VEQTHVKVHAVGGSYTTAYRNCSGYKNGNKREKKKTAYGKAEDDKTITKR